MNYEQFAWWLHGLLEIGNPTTLDERQVQIIKDHLNLMFNKVTPNRYVKMTDIPSPSVTFDIYYDEKAAEDIFSLKDRG